MTATNLPAKLRAIADTLVGDEWEHPLDAVATCRKAADEIERLLAVEEAHLHSSADDADTIADYQARHETSLEVIRARERQVESQRVEIERLKKELGVKTPDRPDVVRTVPIGTAIRIGESTVLALPYSGDGGVCDEWEKRE